MTERPPNHSYHTIHGRDMHAKKNRDLRICLQEFIACGCSHLLVLRLTRPTFARIELRVNVTPSQSSNLLIIKHWMKDQRNSKMLFIDSFLHFLPLQNSKAKPRALRSLFFSTNHQLVDLKFGSESVFKSPWMQHLSRLWSFQMRTDRKLEVLLKGILRD